MRPLLVTSVLVLTIALTTSAGLAASEPTRGGGGTAPAEPGGSKKRPAAKNRAAAKERAAAKKRAAARKRAAAKKRRAGKKRRPGRTRKPAPKINPATQLYYRVSASGTGSWHVDITPDPVGTVANEVTDIKSSWEAASRTAVLLYRTSDPRHPSAEPSYDTTAGITGTVTEYRRQGTAEAWQHPRGYCSGRTITTSALKPASLEGTAGISVTPGHVHAQVKLDTGVDSGVSRVTDTGMVCGDNEGHSWDKFLPGSRDVPGAWGDLVCGNGRSQPPADEVRTDTGTVKWGGAFTFDVHCHLASSNHFNGYRSVTVSSSEFTISFKPCPGGGVNVKAC